MGFARYTEAIADRVVHTEIDNIRAFGDIFHLTFFPRVTINSVSATVGSVTNQTVTLSEGQLTVDQWREATVEIVDKSGIQSLFGDPKKLAMRFAKEFAPALAEDMDNKVLAEHSNITTNVVGDTAAPVDFKDSHARAAMQKLDEARIPKKNRGFVLSPKAYWDMFGQEKYSSAAMMGTSKGAVAGGPDVLPSIYGAKWFQSQEVAVSGALDKNLLLHKDTIALGVQRNVDIQIFAKTQLSTRINGNILYGVKTIRENHGCVINTAT